jgi:hypothetical protein
LASRCCATAAANHFSLSIVNLNLMAAVAPGEMSIFIQCSMLGAKAAKVSVSVYDIDLQRTIFAQIVELLQTLDGRDKRSVLWMGKDETLDEFQTIDMLLANQSTSHEERLPPPPISACRNQLPHLPAPWKADSDDSPRGLELSSSLVRRLRRYRDKRPNSSGSLPALHESQTESDDDLDSVKSRERDCDSEEEKAPVAPLQEIEVIQPNPPSHSKGGLSPLSNGIGRFWTAVSKISPRREIDDR